MQERMHNALDNTNKNLFLSLFDFNVLERDSSIEGILPNRMGCTWRLNESGSKQQQALILMHSVGI